MDNSNKDGSENNQRVLKNKILVVDDEKDICELVGITLMRMGEKPDVVYGVSEAKNKLSKEKYSLVLTDMRMPDGLGIEVIEFLRDELKLKTPIAVITAYAKTNQAVEAMQKGAFDYLEKPISIGDLRELVEKVRDMEAEASSGRDGRKAEGKASRAREDSKLPRLLGSSPAIEEVKSRIVKFAEKDIPIYITGESGTGKEQAARSVHELSFRKAKPFIAVNCGAIPETLMESEFFGYVKGSFTGANGDKVGFFQAANGGTLFLDEVADLPLNMQVKLLRAIQEKAVRRIGDQKESSVDVRIICATHKNLAKEVAMGRFRQDLYYRLNIVTLDMPPLRSLKKDLDMFVSNTLKRVEPHKSIRLSNKAKEALRNYEFPGNFRELENILMRASALCEKNVIQEEDLMLRHEDAALWSMVADSTESPAGAMRVWVRASEKAGSGAGSGAEDPGSCEREVVLRLGEEDLEEMMGRVERAIFGLALRQAVGDEGRAARALGLSSEEFRTRLRRSMH